MRAHEFITEGLSSKLYHYTTIPHALSILKDGAFKLASVVGSSHEHTINPTKYPYFLSTTRTKHGGYHDPYDQGVMFNLDGNYYQQHYKGMPVDYWGDKHLQHKYGRKHEAEDRIVSKSPSIPVDGVSEIHIFLSEKLEKDSKIPQYARNLMILAKQRGIKCFIYTDKSAWMNQQTAASVGIKQHPSLQGKNIPSYYRHNKYGDPVDRWMELISKNSTVSLSPRANDTLKNILYYYQPGRTMNADIDFSNARKPNSSGYNSLVKVIKFMQQQGYTSVADLVSHLHNKWRSIKDNEQNQGN